ncbi:MULTISPECIES: GntP family permease [unclassified Polynucleobacter]|uniref:GntP family permease n=1 Tax=unclassified Polynucleobacter TaxID=2640945 RepID=UPI0008AB0BE0|nr:MULTISPECIES: GntP family permease [unclassified Polynucleobacter]OHC10915.1 MAG: transporter [Polynucleobacter sp. GWA2_45_21]HBK44500.1 transporter [Polynucleobacter sp.]
MDLIAIVVSLGLLMLLAYRGMSVLILAPVMALLAVLLSGNPGDLLPVYTQVFMKAMGGYLIQYFPLFLLGSVFGKLMESSGYALVIANGITQKLGSQHALLAVVLACAILTYGGVSLFVVAFMMYPIGKSLFERSAISLNLLPGAIALGAFTFTMTALPGTPSVQNSIPSPFFGTDAFAAPGLGLIASCVMLGFGTMWLNRQKRLLGKIPAKQEDMAVDFQPSEKMTADPKNISFQLAIVPILLMGLTNLLMAKWFLPNWRPEFLQNNTFSITSLSSLAGIWAIIIALSVGILFIYALQVIFAKQTARANEAINQGSIGSMLPILNTASEVGYGSVIASLGGFILIREFVLSIAPGNPLISEAVAVNALAGITGSASGGMSIALQTLGADYLAKAVALGISPEILHRIAVMASGCMDTLPHNGAVITLLGICQLTHREGYRYIAMVTIVFPLIALVLVITLASLFGSF